MKVREFAQQLALLHPGDRVLCALSGGPDSVVLTHVLWSLAPQLHLTVAAAHFTHGLRPEAAEEERALCAALCKQLEIPLFCGSGDVGAFARAQKIGLEEAARLLRYDFLERTADDLGADAIATGHNRGDNAETVLFHLARGSGLRGLCGIPPRRGRIIRPLLNTGRDEILAYAAEQGLRYTIDRSNLEDGCSRNQIRHRVLPQMEAMRPGAEAQIAACALRLADDEDCLSGMAARVLAEETQPGVAVQRLQGLHSAVQYRVLRQLYETASAGLALSQAQVRAALALCAAREGGQISLPGGFACRVEQGRLTMEQEKTPAVPFPVELVPEIPVLFGEWELLLTQDPAADGFCFGPGQIEFPVIARSRLPGDRIPMGGGQRKLVKKLLNESKIPKDMRDSIPILCDNKGVFAVAGLKGDPSRAAGPGTNGVTLVCRRIKR